MRGVFDRDTDMETTGQAGDSPEPIDDLANFLTDNPEAGEPEDDPRSKESDEDNSDEDEDDEDAADDEDKPDPKEAEKQPALTFKVPVKGEDGTDQTIEVDEKELVAGYQRHADYTRKTQELGNREREVTQAVATKLQEGQQYYIEQAQLAQSLVRQLAGLKTQDEMSQLAMSDPSAWVQEQQRERYINSVLENLQSGIQRETQQSRAQREQQDQAYFAKAGTELKEAGFTKAALLNVFQTVEKAYGIPVDKSNQIQDASFVKVMRDAAAYQDLIAKRADVVKKAQAAPKLPPQKQTLPRNEQATKRLNARFSNGRAKLNDLAAFLENS